MRFVCLILLILATTRCSRRVLVRYTQRPPEIHSTESLAQIMLVNRLPRIVLRVPESRAGWAGKTSDNQWPESSVRADFSLTNGLLYNTIEKQLFRDDFTVRDRNLFNDVLTKASSVDYSQMHGLTNTDLILEWINMDRQVGYNTNVCYRQKLNGREKSVLLPTNFRRLGASIEFKLIAVKTNEVVGTYRFYYTPCTQGCAYQYKNGRLEPYASRVTISPYELVDPNELEIFITDATRQLTKAMRP